MKLAPPTIETVPIGQLQPWSKNPRKNHAVEGIAKSIEAFGYLAPIVVQKGTYRILAGHGRLEALKARGATEVPVVVADVTDEQASLYTLADNKLTEMAEWDAELLAGLVNELVALEQDLSLTGFSAKELSEIEAWLPPDQREETDDVPAPPANPVSQSGDVWQLGHHRLMCGDSTSPSDVTSLLSGERAALMATDPPYLVDYSGGNHPQSWHNKPETRSHYMWQHEPCFYGWLEGKSPELRPEPNLTTVWHIDQKQIEGIHPTEKPLEIFAIPLRSHLKPGGLAYEPFSGSGSQIIAGEREGRRVYAMEISPAFVDVAVIRWQRFTGKVATNLTRPDVRVA